LHIVRENRELRRRAGQRGQSLTEFALVAPILFALVFGVYDFGRGMSANVTVTNSAREGARYLATHATSWQTPGGGLPASQGRFDTACQGAGANPSAPLADSAQGVSWRQLQNASLTLSAVTMTVRFYASSNDPNNGGAADDTLTCSSGAMSESNPAYTPQSGDWVRFEVRYQYAPVTPLISSIVSTVTLDQITTMVLE
jgi:Flp pilus assembly protein TadG